MTRIKLLLLTAALLVAVKAGVILEKSTAQPKIVVIEMPNCQYSPDPLHPSPNPSDKRAEEIEL